jgi:hypothetical protein
VPITKLQSHVLRVLAAGRSPDSYIAGASDADASALTDAGLKLTWSEIQSGRRQAEVESCGETMQLEWVADSAFRFFPAQPDELFGYVLHAVDLATNKASAAADRREPRDIVDLVTIHESVLPLGAVVCAAVGRFPGQSPERNAVGHQAPQPVYLQQRNSASWRRIGLWMCPSSTGVSGA